nr:GNAT family N-acetyltransferase [uncultured Methanobrevibacter sp.]
MDIIIKDDNTQKVFLTENTLDVCEILEEHYLYILESIRNEEFLLKYDECNLFKELVFEKKVVGFCSYDFSREFITASMNNIYVLPEFRGNGIFYDELKRTMQNHNKPSIMEPTRLVVELLIKYGLARKVTDSLVASAIEFVIPANHVMSNADYANEELSTHFYDLGISRCIHILDLKKHLVAYSSPLNYDLIHYDDISSIDDDYFNCICDLFKDNAVELMNSVLMLEESLAIRNYTLDEVIGKGDEFSIYIESLIDDAHVTRAKALEIKEQIREEYEAGMILNESLLIRLAYLFDEGNEPSITSHDETCPYCSMPIDDHDRYCHFCGINLNYNPDEMQDSLITTIGTYESDFSEDIRFVAYKFLILIDEGIDLDYSIFTIENNYNISWDNLNDFLDKNGYFGEGKITSEGYDFINSHPLHFWQKYQMDIVDYTDFENYFYSHNYLDPKEICLNYLKQFSDDEYIVELIEEIQNDCSDN